METMTRISPPAVEPVSVPVSPERVTPIRPSEALRLGRLEYPIRIEGHYRDEAKAGACAWGAIEAGGYASDDSEFTHCDLCDDGCWGLEGRVIHLNDEHHWADSQIVPWLEARGL